jgi:hypothetical protein
LPSASIIFRLEGSPAKPFGDGTNALREIRAQAADAQRYPEPRSRCFRQGQPPGPMDMSRASMKRNRSSALSPSPKGASTVPVINNGSPLVNTSR